MRQADSDALGGSIEEINAVLARREPIYRSLMTIELDVTALNPDEAAAAIQKLLPTRRTPFPRCHTCSS